MPFIRPTKEEAKAKILALVESFKRNYDDYKNAEYKEQRVRQEYIDLFFEALGWDIRNEEKVPNKYKEVVIEDILTIDGQSKAPDYSFNYWGSTKFYVEAKKPAVDIKNEQGPALQVRRYAYTKKLPVSILTDFEEFSVYDTRIKPKEGDKSSVARDRYIYYTDYEKEFEYIWQTFSFESVRLGLFDKSFEDSKNKRGTGEIDTDLLNTIEGWRLNLAKNIALRNPDLSLRNLNVAVQKIIDRLIFLRIAEDKDIEIYEQLKDVLVCDNIYKGLKVIFKNANDKYNSGLFEYLGFIDELIIDNNVLKEIIEDLYPPKCPYAWKVLPIEILGNIYESFLGSEITFKNIKGGHTVKVEQKPEIKKAGGVYYTPQYIVDYIVEMTLGEKLKDLPFSKADKLTVVDPSCGSGSFLIGAYKYLLKWYLEYYLKDEDKYKKGGKLIETAKGTQLSVEEKKRILVNHIYGVDIDNQAVEVTKLSLFLQMLEEEGDSLNNLFRGSALTVLPNMKNNIKCGNSLVGSDFNESHLDLIFDEEFQYKINVFDWEEQFKDIFAEGGFDIVIGNPPYISAPSQVDIKELKMQRDFLATCEKYKTLYQKWDLYIPFVEKGLQILKEGGIYSSIIPYPVTNQIYGYELRKMIINDYNLVELADLKGTKVFKNATVTNCIPFIKKEKPKGKVNISHINDSFKFNLAFTKPYSELVQDEKKQIWNLTEEKRDITKHSDMNILGDFCYISYGLRPNSDEKTARGKFKKEDLISEVIDDIPRRKYIEAKDIEKYKINRIRFLEYGTKRSPGQICRPTFPEFYEYPKLFMNRLGDLICSIDYTDKITHNDSIIGAVLWKDLKSLENKSISSSIKKFSHLSRADMENLSTKINLKYILGIMNSKYANILLNNLRGGDYHIYPEHVRNIPIPLASEEKQNEIVDLVDKITEGKKALEEMSKSPTVNPDDLKMKEKALQTIENIIDKKVYDLYSLTPEEIDLIENS
ncbi:MAG: N-6 DNA methylase [Abditibacteriota bacterium]|nr:N-6 DNA methylase [Abditibacteriota bacterium]